MTSRNRNLKVNKQRQAANRHSGQEQAAPAAVYAGPRSPVVGWVAAIVAWLSVAVVVFVLTYRPVMDPDTWFHLAAGEWIAENDAVPRTDPFSYTAGDTPYVPSGWLTALLMHKLDALYPFSSLGPILMVTVITALAGLIIMLRGWRSGTTVATGLLVMAGLCMAAVRLSPRPDVWSLLGMAALLWLLTADWFRKGRMEDGKAGDGDLSDVPRLWRLWLLPPLIIVWANLHAGVLVAVPFLLTYAVWLVWQWRKTRNDAWANAALPVAIACVAWQVNPYGPGIADLAWRISNIPQVTWVMEWMPFFKKGFALATPVYWAAFFLVAIACWAVLKRFRQFHPLEIVWLIMLVLLAMFQRRQVGLMAVGVPLILARHLVPMEAWLQRGLALKPAILPAALAGLIAWLQVSGANGNGGGRPAYGKNCSVLPCITADFLEQNPSPQPIFNSYNLGGYLLNALYPGTRVYIDGRLDVYPHQVWLDMLAVEENRLSIDEMMKRYGIETFVVGTRDSYDDPMHLASRLSARPDFTLVHMDDVAAVFVRRTTDNIDYLNKFGYPSLSPWDLPKMAQTVANPRAQQQIINDVGRLLMQSGQAASASALAAYIAWVGGDPETMNEQLSWARLRQPDNGLLRVVEQRMRLAAEAVGAQQP